MRLLSYGCLGSVALAVQTVVGAPELLADEPTIKMLVDGTPILTPHGERLNGFQFECEVQTWFQVPFIAKFVWSRPDRFGVIVAAGEERTPFLFLSEERSMDFDVTTGTVILVKDAAPRFIVRADGKKFTLDLSITSGAEAEVAIDLPSFLSEATRTGRLRQDSGGDWRLTTVSKSGKTNVTAVFRNCDGFPIRRLEMRSVVDDSLVLAIRDIAINAEADTTWPNFPAAESFPKGLKIARASDLKVETHADGLGVAARGVRTMAAQAALRNPKWRNIPFLDNVDWASAQRANREFGPPLRALFNVPSAEPPDAPEPPIGSKSNG